MASPLSFSTHAFEGDGKEEIYERGREALADERRDRRAIMPMASRDHKSGLSHRHRTCQCELRLKISPAKWNYWTI